MFLLSVLPIDDENEEIAVGNVDYTGIEYIYKNYYGYVCNLLSTYLPECREIDDLVQDIFVSIIKNRIDFNLDYEPGVRNYLKIVCKNKAQDYAKKKKTTLYYPDVAFLKHEDMNGAPDDVLIAKEAIDEVTKIILSLSDKLKEACYLKYASGLNNRQIAKTLGITESAVAARLFKARREIKAKYEKH